MARSSCATVDDAYARDASIVVLLFNDRTAGLSRFYNSLGFTIAHPGNPFRLDFAELPGKTIGFPLDNPNYRFAYRVLRSDRVTVR